MPSTAFQPTKRAVNAVRGIYLNILTIAQSAAEHGLYSCTVENSWGSSNRIELFVYGKSIYMVNQPTPIHSASVYPVCYLEHNSFTSCEDLFVKIHIANCRTGTMILSHLTWWPEIKGLTTTCKIILSFHDNYLIKSYTLTCRCPQCH